MPISLGWSKLTVREWNYDGVIIEDLLVQT